MGETRNAYKDLVRKDSDCVEDRLRWGVDSGWLINNDLYILVLVVKIVGGE
jgi:hypothetical protein